MNPLGPIVWAIVAAGQGAGSAVAAAPIEIVLVGAEPARREMEAAIRTVLSAAPGLSWSGRDAPPGDLLSSTLGGGVSPQIWIDVADSSRVRVVVPARPPSLFAAVRVIAPPDTTEPGHEPVFREAVAQVVSAIVRAMRDDPSAQLRPVAATPLPPSSPPPVARSRPADIDREVTSPTRIRGRFSLAIAAGAHTSPFLLAEPSNQSNWLGLSTSLEMRWEAGRALLALRATGERSERSIDQLELGSQLYSSTLAVFRKLISGWVSLNLGLELGGLALRQHTSILGPNASIPPPSLALPGQIGTTWSAGVLVGPVAEANIAISDRLFIHLTAGLPVAYMNVYDVGMTAWRSSSYARLLAGVGAYL